MPPRANPLTKAIASMPRRFHRLLPSVLAAALLACSGDSAPTTPPPPDAAVATVVTLSASQVSLVSLGETRSLTASVKDQRGQTMAAAPVTWTSSNAEVVGVDASGTVRAAAVGEATVTASSGGASATATVRVTQVPASLTFGAERLAFDAVGRSASVTVSVVDARQNPIPGAAITWATSNPAVATVSEVGVVTSRGSGAAAITASLAPVSASLGVTVNLWGPQDARVIAAFKGPVRKAPDSYIVQWALTDFDGDGNEDVALSAWTACGGQVGCGTGATRNPAGPLRLFRRASDGSMRDVSAELLPGPVSSYSNVPVAADFNGDGMPDLFLAGFTDDPPADGPSTILMSAAGRYTVDQDGTQVWAHGASAFDVDGDGCQDLLLGDNEAPLWRGNCSGTLIRTSFGGLNPVPLSGATGLELDGPGWGMGICAGDFDADGSLDLVYTDAIVRASDGSRTPNARNNVIVEVDWAQANPAIRSAHALPLPLLDRDTPAGSERSHDMRCRVADLDGDGDEDIFIGSTRWPEDGVSWGGSRFQVYLNQGGWSFTDVSDRAFPGRNEDGPYGFNPIVRDLNDDGAPDLVFAGRAWDPAIPPNPVWLGNGDGTFRVSQSVDMGGLRTQAADLVNAYANIPPSRQTFPTDEIAPVRRATGEYDFLVTHVATDNVPTAESAAGTPTIYVVFIPMGVRF